MQKPEAVRAARRHRVPLSIDDPRPVAAISAVWRSTAQAATIGIFVILTVAALSEARPGLLPVVSALVVTMMLGPLSSRADRYGVPPLVSAILLWLLVVAVVYGVLLLLAAPAVEWVGKAPEIGRSIQDKLHVLDQPLNSLRDLRNALLPGQAQNNVGIDLVSIVQPAVTIITPAIGQTFIFLGTLFFMLFGRDRMRRVLIAFFDEREARLRTLKIMNDIERNLTGYLSIVAVINVAVGCAAGFIAAVAGLPNPVAWAVLGFILNFIPYLGALIMELALFLVGLVTFPTLAHAGVAPFLYIAVATVEGHFLTPGIIGRRLTLNPLTVFLSLVFWTWLWGPVGAFLAAPLLIVAQVAVGHLFPNDEPALPDTPLASNKRSR